jgi:hypothetical protein
MLFWLRKLFSSTQKRSEGQAWFDSPLLQNWPTIEQPTVSVNCPPLHVLPLGHFPL